MKNNKRKLELLISLGIINIEDFYSISFTGYDLVIQGNYNAKLIEKLKASGFSFYLETNNNYVNAIRNNIKITLTD